MRRLLIACAALLALGGVAKADDHLFNALQHGLSPDGQPFQPNPAGHSGDTAAGQGSPFTGADMQTPATDNETAADHANVKAREAK
ncbi:hypothetical protein [Aminobacter sp. BE322]|uniref:hypothetical protein n=1 Tax=unclassified Aminobacter TaxID=2644704 RepID=UPI003D247603